MDKFVNLHIIKNPVNWLIVVTILSFAAWCGFTVWNAAKGRLEV